MSQVTSNNSTKNSAIFHFWLIKTIFASSKSSWSLFNKLKIFLIPHRKITILSSNKSISKQSPFINRSMLSTSLVLIMTKLLKTQFNLSINNLPIISLTIKPKSTKYTILSNPIKTKILLILQIYNPNPIIFILLQIIKLI